MGMYSGWLTRNPDKSDKQIVNIEWVLIMMDQLTENNTTITGARMFLHLHYRRHNK